MTCFSVFAQQVKYNGVPGVVINYQDVETQQYIGSPGICILPNGDYIATHDLFGKGSTEFSSAVSKVFLSKNKGKSWKQIAVLDGQFWSKPFVHGNNLYIMGTDKHHGNVVIKKSTDGGYTWTKPVDGKSGLLMEGEFHCAPMPVISSNGYLWRAMERADGEIKKWGFRYGTFMMSIKDDADLLNATNWRHTNTLPYDSTYLNGDFGAWIEGNAVLTNDNNIVNILRVHNPKDKNNEWAAVVNISPDGLKSSFNKENGFIKFPGGGKKFSIRFDEKTQRYLAIVNYVPKEFRGTVQLDRVRNTQAFVSSKDLKTWYVHEILLQHPDIKKHGFNYVDWEFNGENIIYVSRTAYDFKDRSAKNYHDANFLTFHKIKNYKKLFKKSIDVITQ
ncbi:sialidase family protein [Pedobacter arcticus]|uniref:sialidase family protein n=1 Tax=Pedobacter arcticus TaxID=752140 RepID=UPI00031E9116|nr:sialidase family protein [Pedobacter arcticus]